MEPVDRFARPLEKHLRRVVAQRGERSRERREVPLPIEGSRCRRLVRAVTDEEAREWMDGEEAIEPVDDDLVWPVLENVFHPIQIGPRIPVEVARQVGPNEPAPAEPLPVRCDDCRNHVDSRVFHAGDSGDVWHPLEVAATYIAYRPDALVNDEPSQERNERLAKLASAPRAAAAVPSIAGIDAAENRLRVHTVHLVFGMTPDFGGKPWSWVHHTAVECAKAANPGAEVWLWYEHEPSGKWWDATAAIVRHCRIEAPESIHGRPLVHPAHRADVVRLQALEQFGGAYIDADVWCLRPFEELAHGGFLMGWQGRGYGLCNATMIAEAGSPFVARWLAEYASFRSKGHDRFWDEHSVRLPRKLARKHPNEITTVPTAAFFDPDWNTVHEVFQVGRQPRLNLAWSCHLWESKTWAWLQNMTPETIDRGSEIARRLNSLGVL